MSNFEQEHFYYVDPGIGEKNRGCPYTFYKDGRDVRSFITPPSGYELTDFKLEPYPEDKFYDGKIVAQYKKIPFSDTMNLKILKRVLGIIIVGILAVLAFFIIRNYHKPKPTIQPLLKPQSEITAIPIDTTVQKQVTDTSAIAEDTITLVLNPISTEEVVKEEVQEEVLPVAETDEVNKKKDEVDNQKNEIAQKSEKDPEPTQESQPEVNLTKEQFKQEFWNLIHRRESRMRTYGELYRKYKGLNIKSKEFYYLYSTILENNYGFDAWKAKLVSIPESEIKSINTIKALKEKIEEYEE